MQRARACYLIFRVMLSFISPIEAVRTTLPFFTPVTDIVCGSIWVMEIRFGLLTVHTTDTSDNPPFTFAENLFSLLRLIVVFVSGTISIVEISDTEMTTVSYNPFGNVAVYTMALGIEIEGSTFMVPVF